MMAFCCAFQSTPPYRGRLWYSRRFPALFIFQSTPPYRGRPCADFFLSPAGGYFNPRPRIGGDTTDGVIHCTPTVTAYFNPRPRIGGDSEIVQKETISVLILVQFRKLLYISISIMHVLYNNSFQNPVRMIQGFYVSMAFALIFKNPFLITSNLL